MFCADVFLSVRICNIMTYVAGYEFGRALLTSDEALENERRRANLFCERLKQNYWHYFENLDLKYFYFVVC